MPRWLIRMVRMSVIGIGVTMVLLAGINLWAMHALFDASVEHQLGITADELRPLFYVLALIGFLMALLGALVPVPKAMLAQAKSPQDCDGALGEHALPTMAKVGRAVLPKPPDSGFRNLSKFKVTSSRTYAPTYKRSSPPR